MPTTHLDLVTTALARAVRASNPPTPSPEPLGSFDGYASWFIGESVGLTPSQVNRIGRRHRTFGFVINGRKIRVTYEGSGLWDAVDCGAEATPAPSRDLFRIVYTYTDGNTFNTNTDNAGAIDHVFTSIEDARIALSRMREHYLWCLDQQTANRRDNTPQPSWWKPDPRFVGTCFEGKLQTTSMSFNTPHEGADVWLSASVYCGYFESLEGAALERIDPDLTEDDSFIL